MSGSPLQLDDRDLNQLMKQFHRLGDGVKKKVGRSAVNAGALPVVQAARREVPVDDGTLRRSIGKKAKAYPNISTAVAYIGARITGRSRGYHAHLVEQGHIASDGSFVPGNPWLKRAVASSSDAAFERMSRKLFEQIDKEASQ